MKSLEARFKFIQETNPYNSSLVCFNMTVKRQRFNRIIVRRWFNKLVDKEDYNKKDKNAILEHTFRLGMEV